LHVVRYVEVAIATDKHMLLATGKRGRFIRRSKRPKLPIAILIQPFC
jgi:hypothetical protein